MKTTDTTRKGIGVRPLSQSDLSILSAVARFHYLTAAQVNRLVFPESRDEFRYARRRLALLVDDGLLVRLAMAALRSWRGNPTRSCDRASLRVKGSWPLDAGGA